MHRVLQNRHEKEHKNRDRRQSSMQNNMENEMVMKSYSSLSLKVTIVCKFRLKPKGKKIKPDNVFIII